MENNNTNLEEEFEDALSLCDFALDEDQENIIQQLNESSPSSQENNYFQFSTKSTSPSSQTNYQNIIFCGKIISCKTENNHENQRFKNNPLVNKNKIPVLPPQASKKHKAILGLAKIPSKMELSDLRERQKRKQNQLAAVGGRAVVVSGDGSGRKSHNWGLLQNIASMLTRSSSLSCLRLARPCID